MVGQARHQHPADRLAPSLPVRVSSSTRESSIASSKHSARQSSTRSGWAALAPRSGAAWCELQWVQLAVVGPGRVVALGSESFAAGALLLVSPPGAWRSGPGGGSAPLFVAEVVVGRLRFGGGRR